MDGRTPKADLNDVLLTMGMADGARYLIREYHLPLTEAEYYDVMRDVIAQLYETVDLKPGVRTLLAKLQAEGARLCLCSNTWSDQCRTVLTRLGIADYFSFIVEAQGVLHKSRPEVFFECPLLLPINKKVPLLKAHSAVPICVHVHPLSLFNSVHICSFFNASSKASTLPSSSTFANKAKALE